MNQYIYLRTLDAFGESLEEKVLASGVPRKGESWGDDLRSVVDVRWLARGGLYSPVVVVR